MTSNVFVGYDTREDIAYQVCEFSIKRFNPNVAITPLVQHELRQKKIYWREVDKLASTEFTFTRFLVPHLMNFKGWALFIDCDIVFLEDVNNLFSLADDRYAVMCVKHQFNPKPGLKMDGQVQTVYPGKIGLASFCGIVRIHLMRKLLLIVSTILISMEHISIGLVGWKMKRSENSLRLELASRLVQKR